MHVQKTSTRTGVTLQYGHFRVRERVYVCASGCRQLSGERITERPAGLSELFPPRSVVGYDVMVYVGLQRFVYYRQRAEIQDALFREHGISLSTGEVSSLYKRFLAYLERLHVDRAPQLRAALMADGGWPLHLDATCEDGRGTLLVVMAGWRRWVLGAFKVPTERADAILPHLEAVVGRFGAPCAVMRDLGRAVTQAAQRLVDKLDGSIPVLACHLHFLADVGKDLLGELHGELRDLFRRRKTRADIRALARDLGRGLGQDIGQARTELLAWQQQLDVGHRVPEGRAGLAVVRSLCQWVLDYPADGQDLGFPFDRPYLDFHERCRKGLRAVDAFLRNPPEHRRVLRALKRFHRLLVRVVDHSFTGAARRMYTRIGLFERLRAALRIQPKKTAAGRTEEFEIKRPEDQAAELLDIETTVEQLARELRRTRPERGPAQDKRQAIDIILEHLDRHGHFLWGHAISLPQASGGIRLVERTNNILETFFHTMKHGERRRCGRKLLTQDFEHLPPAAALARNLTRSDYVDVLCGSLDQIPPAFAQLDAACRAAKRAGCPVPNILDATHQSEVASASLPSEDRRIIRTQAMQQRVENAARSRAPAAARMVV
jgi:hypothetical protein